MSFAGVRSSSVSARHITHFNLAMSRIRCTDLNQTPARRRSAARISATPDGAACRVGSVADPGNAFYLCGRCGAEEEGEMRIVIVLLLCWLQMGCQSAGGSGQSADYSNLTVNKRGGGDHGR
jgi:hypothetical protein